VQHCVCRLFQLAATHCHLLQSTAMAPKSRVVARVQGNGPPELAGMPFELNVLSDTVDFQFAGSVSHAAIGARYPENETSPQVQTCTNTGMGVWEEGGTHKHKKQHTIRYMLLGSGEAALSLRQAFTIQMGLQELGPAHQELFTQLFHGMLTRGATDAVVSEQDPEFTMPPKQPADRSPKTLHRLTKEELWEVYVGGWGGGGIVGGFVCFGLGILGGAVGFVLFWFVWNIGSCCCCYQGAAQPQTVGGAH